MKILDTHFNAAVVGIVNRLFPCGYDVGSPAPSTLKELNDHIKKTGRILVYSGASENTIYGDKEINYAARAWHDYHHYKLQAPFNKAGEALVCEAQKQDLLKIFGDSPRTRLWMTYLDIEVNDMVEYYEKHGVFPEDQYAFVKERLKQRQVTRRGV